MIAIAALPEWIAVDLDGTLAKEGEDSGMPKAWTPYAVGDPISASIDRIKGYLEKGSNVSIFTSRIDVQDPELKMQVTMAIQAWCKKNIGQILEVTCTKSSKFTRFEDDRAVGVERNTGKLLSDPREAESDAVKDAKGK